MTPKVIGLVLALAAMGCAPAAQADVPRAPDVLVLGDSQLSFGAGQAFVAFFDRLKGQCGLGRDATVGVIGVRSSSLQSWTSQGAAAKAAICDVDPTWKVNAGAYGTLSQGKNPFVQIGKGAAFQFCRRDRSPLGAVFDAGYYRPKLLIMFLLGNATERWANSPAAAMQDAQSFLSDLPKDHPCIFMTSAPPFRKDLVRLRKKAQDNIEAAFAKEGGRCSFVEGLTDATIAENMGNAANFRRSASGKVKDPFHPTEAAARKFLALKRDDLCHAVAAELAPLGACCPLSDRAPALPRHDVERGHRLDLIGIIAHQPHLILPR